MERQKITYAALLAAQSTREAKASAMKNNLLKLIHTNRNLNLF
jgi:hypothetical protein